eukprot:CAMPEP_0168507974 /NCGR_PEP_ID=MMETSP0228-20121227/78147_1 /TAXON_ID=133427 /ORGANISM="Protoceratium reticulatum, Strain CCCM 535 (=CCMP 1889)" /LENGTH=77 /DNA_ID=CAMNT_0008525077 /DNA_START=237 /DNA_END=470 /DNA_ORIENTATION=+
MASGGTCSGPKSARASISGASPCSSLTAPASAPSRAAASSRAALTSLGPNAQSTTITRPAPSSASLSAVRAFSARSS